MIIEKVRNHRNKYGFTCRCKCDICGKLFYRKACWAERTDHQFCTEECACVYKSKQVMGKGNNHWIGGRRTRTDGYIGLYKPEHPDKGLAKVVPEHRLVMEKMVGRRLSPKEIVHHINGIRNDNRPKNLLLFKGHSEHCIYHWVQRKIIIILSYLFKYNCLNLIFKEEK